MSFFKRMFGGASAAEERARGDELFAAGEVFEARQCYERAIEKDKGADGALGEHCRARIAECFDALARLRITEAEELRKDGQLEAARAELETALEVARSPKVKEKARRAIEMLERKDAIEQAADTPELSDEERWSVIESSWEDRQAAEYERYEGALKEALLALADQKLEEAKAKLEALAQEHADDAVYLWLEIGRARLAGGDEEGGAKALRRFLKRVAEIDDGDGEGSNARLAAHLQLSVLAERAGDEEKAISWLNKAIAAMPDDPRPYLQLGVYLRSKGYAEEAIEVLETGSALMDDQPKWEADQELGLAKMDAGREQEAIDLFERVVHFFVSRSRVDLPRATALALAKLHEKGGRLDRAADLYRALANGSDRANHLEYHREAGRVLAELGLLSEARRMLTRAAALAEDKPEALAEIEAKIADLDAQLG